MKDERIERLARTLVRYSIGVKKDQTVGISAGVAAEPLVLAVYEQVLECGAFPAVRMAPRGASEIFYSKGKPHHFKTLTSLQKAYAQNLDAYIGIKSATNTRELSSTDPGKQAEHAKTMKPVSDMIHRNPWVLTLFPTEAYAQDAEMSCHEFEDFVYATTYADTRNPVSVWKSISRKQERLISRLKGADKVRIAGPGTDLTLSVKGRSFVNSDGKRNMPSGEVFAAPIEDSAEGTIQFDYPVCYSGREIDGVRLVFRKGRVVEACAEKNEAFLKAMLETDSGAKRLGELGIGTNFRIDRFIKNILFDEKIGGTVHLALGRSPLQTGGRNNSAVHWDMIKDLRKGGALYVDGKAFQKDGKFV
jgi:aminopeptidase